MKETPLKILHIAPSNTSNVPATLVLKEREMGYKSRLLTLYANNRGYYEDICLYLPFIDFVGTFKIKQWVSSPQKINLINRCPAASNIPIVWTPYSRAEKMFIDFRDWLWSFKIHKAIKTYGLENFDVYQLDGGLGLYRNSSFIQRMHKRGKKIICCYTGSDLRTRGVIPQIDRISHLNVTVEFDHLELHPDIHHVFFPFSADPFSFHQPNRDTIRIGHAPTNWDAKGSHIIVPLLYKLQTRYAIEVVLIENLPHKKALEAKQRCDIFIDQIGELGYGMNSLESLAMGIPTCSCLAPGFAEKYPHHPFVVVDENNLEKKLIDLIQSPQQRLQLGKKGIAWVKKYHSATRTVEAIHQLAGIG